MTDKTILKIIELFDSECMAQNSDPWGVSLNTAGSNVRKVKRCKQKTDVYLNSLNSDDLNDLIVMVKVGMYDAYKKNDASWIRAKEKLSIDDQALWKKEVGAGRLSSDQCINYLRSHSSRTIVDSVFTYLTMKPLTHRQHAILKKINEMRINTRFSESKIEKR